MASSSSSQGGLVELASPSLQPQIKTPLISYLGPAGHLYSRFSQWRTSIGLPNPGTVEGLQKEVKNTLLTNFFFDGARADLNKALSMNPAFQVTHSFHLASQTSMPSYNFGAVFANASLFLQGGVDHDGNLNARINQGWSPNNVTKIQASISGDPQHEGFQMEHDYQGQDYSVNAKMLNPSPIDLSGVFIGSYLQSITKNLAVGMETVYQRMQNQSGINTSALIKYTSTERNWIATTQLQPSGILQSTYWQKLSDKVDFAADFQAVIKPQMRDAIASLGVKYDLRMSTVRAQVDSTGKVSALLEQRFAPTFAFLVSGEIDHFRNSAKVGVGVIIETSTLTPEEMGMPSQPYPPPYP
ncbi:hypothetical protein BD410DRAFT_782573 [Rickenella mellea]|uniref:Mitochondrial import receptor subunit TOM40 n=1 Tax=Rickenella mellea TaxID=50990 RepID=A0A4Y7QJF7_9AGAM|nr:hypothetical protein BD410DRAFT_782573 [Rickenella mellea]